MNIKRKFDELLAKGQGKQLLWLMAIAIVCLGAALAISQFVFTDGSLTWQDVVSGFLSGDFEGNGEHDWFRLCLSLLGIFFFSALLVSMFTNVFENICESARNGERRYKMKGHVLILGGGYQLKNILRKLADCGKDVVVMSEARPEIEGDYIYYKGMRDLEADLKSACPEKAETIYLIGNDKEPDHDARSLCALELLKNMCLDAPHDIHCYLTIEDQLTTEVFQYLKQKPEDKHLLVDVINESEYQAEQLLVGTSFLPVIKQGENRHAHIIILGLGTVAQAVANTVAHICHYPSYPQYGKRTIITFIGENMKEWRDEMLASRPVLFEMSHHSYLNEEGHLEKNEPNLKGDSSDFLDVEWNFVEGKEAVPHVRKILENACAEDLDTRIIVCHTDSEAAAHAALHLPRVVYEKAQVAVYLNSSAELLKRANLTGMFGKIAFFGPASETNADPLYTQRSTRGKRVNYIYSKEYKEKVGDVESEWYKISEADKYSSIYCANAMYLRKQCYPLSENDDVLQLPIYEAEHRRWMMSELLMGFVPGPKTDKKRFIHADLVPFDKLTPEEQLKDKLIIDQINYILNG